jgi:hypothetical protein
MDKLVAKIKARVADPKQAVDAASWVHPMPAARRPARLDELNAAEKALGFPIPQLLRTLYLEVGNGGFGPAYGLCGVPTIPAASDQSDIVLIYTELRAAPPLDENPSWCWPHGFVPLIAQGCNIWECVDFLNAPYKVVLSDPDQYDWNGQLIEQLQPISGSLADRLEKWLAEIPKRKRSPRGKS